MWKTLYLDHNVYIEKLNKNTKVNAYLQTTQYNVYGEMCNLFFFFSTLLNFNVITILLNSLRVHVGTITV